MKRKKKPLVYRSIFIGGREWLILESDDKRVIDMLQEGPDGKSRQDQTINGRCLGGNSPPRILVRKGLDKQERYEVFIHEGIHALCDEHRHFKPFADIFDSEEMTHMLTKGLVSYMRQLHALGMMDD